MDTLPQCNAKSKQSGYRCKNFSVKGKKVCWIHGGKSSGPKSQQGVEKIRNLKTKHGVYTRNAVEDRIQFRKFLQEADEMLHRVEEQIK
jgi:hypothetical protein